MALDGIQTRVPVRRFSLDRISYWLLLVAVIFIVLVPPPLAIIPVDLVKRFGFALIVTISFIFWLFAALQNNRLSVPRSPLLASLALVVGVTAISAIFAPDKIPAILGSALEISTLWLTALLVLATFLVSQFFNTKERIITWYGTLLASAVMMIIFQIGRIFLPALTAWVPLVGAAGNLIGTWSDLALFLGFMTASVLLILELIDFSNWRRGWYAFSAVGGLLLVSVIFSAPPLGWWLLGLLALVIFAGQSIYGTRERPLVRPATLVVVVAVVMLILNFIPSAWPRTIDRLYTKVNISVADFRPSLPLTTQIMNSTLRSRPLTGFGPNNFLGAWQQHKPADLAGAGTDEADFEAGYSWVLTQVVMLGIIGAAAWFIFFALLLWSGWQFFRALPADPIGRALGGIIFGGLTYLWAAAWLTTPGAGLIILTFMLTGVWLGFLISLKRLPVFVTVFNRDQLWGLVGVVGSVVLIIFSTLTLYGLTVRSYGWWRYAATVATLNQTGDSRAALADLLAIRGVYRNEVFDRLVVDLANDQLKKLAANTSASVDEQRVTFVALMTQASAVAEKSLAENANNYANWLSRGSLHETVIQFGVENAAAAAERDYQQVIKLNPQSPIGYVALARTYLATEQPAKANAELTKALAIAPNSVPTLLYLAQVKTAQNDLKGAVSLLEEAVLRLPMDARLWLTLGYLRYEAKDYEPAIDALVQTVRLDGSSAEAHYYLALSYAATGEREAALVELRLLQAANPENQELQDIIANVEAGRAALAGPVVPAVTKKR